MNLSKLFEMQKALDERIIKEHGLEGRDLLPNLVLSLQVELGECANEWQGFKHWKVNPQPKAHMLEEYVDCLHFILSIGLKLNADEWDLERYLDSFKPYDNITEHFNDMIGCVNGLRNLKGSEYEYDAYKFTFEMFIGLGEMLGFTWEQVVQAYCDKNKVNHERQDNGY